MSGQRTSTLLTQFIKVHWFKISLVAFLLFLIFKKDFSFTINLNAPVPSEEAEPPSRKPVQQMPPQQRETFTEQASHQTMTPPPTPERGVMDRFDFSSIIGGSERQLKDNLFKISPELVQNYVQRFGKLARTEQKKFGIPASVILANALLHSQAGQSQAATQANNHFNLPCTDDWMGEKWEGKGGCLRVYENAWTSFRDHSFYLTTGDFSNLRKLAPRDYKGWSKALEEKTFAQTDDLAEQLIEVIEQWKLYELD